SLLVFFQAEDGIRDFHVTGVQTCALPIWSLCYVDDLVEGILRLVLSAETGPVNIGNPEEVTVRELAELIQDVVGNHPGIEYIPRDRKSVVEGADAKGVEREEMHRRKGWRR